jgi:MoaA/NifB/PqqE/SkfB family radical SAM enzyme
MKNHKNIENIEKYLRETPPLMGGVDWEISRACNYNCSYCLTKHRRKKEKNSPSSTPIFIDKFAKNLSGNWLFYFNSGEPFLLPDLPKITDELIKMGHHIELVTNFSASLEKIFEFCEVANRGLRRFWASLHLEHADLDEFFKKAILVRRLIGSRLSVASVARRGEVSKLAKIAMVFQNQRIPFSMQLERENYHNNKSARTALDPFVKYSKREFLIIKRFGRTYFLNNKRFLKFKGKLCWAGSKYFVVDANGDAWRCHQARNQDSLGNLLKGTFKLNTVPDICRYEYCACVNPINLGMVVI